MLGKYDSEVVELYKKSVSHDIYFYNVDFYPKNGHVWISEHFEKCENKSSMGVRCTLEFYMSSRCSIHQYLNKIMGQPRHMANYIFLESVKKIENFDCENPKKYIYFILLSNS